MTYETFDNFLILAITMLLYGTSLWLTVAFAIFVLTHDDFNSNDGDRPSYSEPALQEETPEQSIQAPITAESEAALPIQTAASEQLPTDEIACEPVDFTHWKVTDLRCPKLRQSFNIPLRPEGQNRAYRKAELVALYIKATDAIALEQRAA